MLCSGIESKHFLFPSVSTCFVWVMLSDISRNPSQPWESCATEELGYMSEGSRRSLSDAPALLTHCLSGYLSSPNTALLHSASDSFNTDQTLGTLFLSRVVTVSATLLLKLSEAREACAANSMYVRSLSLSSLPSFKLCLKIPLTIKKKKSIVLPSWLICWWPAHEDCVTQEFTCPLNMKR